MRGGGVSSDCKCTVFECAAQRLLKSKHVDVNESQTRQSPEGLNGEEDQHTWTLCVSKGGWVGGSSNTLCLFFCPNLLVLALNSDNKLIHKCAELHL